MSHYFVNDHNLKDEKKLINAELLGVNLSFYSNNGVFSKDKVDYGTRLLINNIYDQVGGEVLDLGCGIGVIGITLAKLNDDIKVSFVDINERALDLAKENLLLNNVKGDVFISDIYTNVSKKYDYIVTNPPIRAGKKVLESMLYGSYDYLKENGILYFVMRKDHGVKSMIKKLESIFKVFVICKDKGFYIVKCSK